jgi:hypothetical protein
MDSNTTYTLLPYFTFIATDHLPGLGLATYTQLGWVRLDFKVRLKWMWFLDLQQAREVEILDENRPNFKKQKRYKRIASKIHN